MIRKLRRAPLTPCGTYTEWFWPPSTSFARTLLAGYKSFEHVVVPEVDPGPESTYFWAHQFRMIGGSGGYIGLQTKGDLANGTFAKMAIFSLWDAEEAEGSNVVPFSGEGIGWSCRIAYPWQAGRAYAMRVAFSGDGWWRGQVRDEETTKVSELGMIRVPEQWRQLDSWSVMWTEYYGPPLSRCSDLAHSSVVFSTPTADDGEVSPAGAHHRVGEGTCETSRIQPVAEGVRHEMGLPY